MVVQLHERGLAVGARLRPVAHDGEHVVTLADDDDLKVELVASDGSVTVLKESIPVLAGEIVDATFMSARNLDAFLAETQAKVRRSFVRILGASP